MNFQFIAIFLLLILGGCGSIEKVIYFSPKPQEQISILPGARGPKEVVKHRLSEMVESKLILFAEPKNGIIRYLFKLPAGETLQFIEHQFQIKDNISGESFPVNIERIQANYIVNGVGSSKYFNIDEQLVGETTSVKTQFGKNTFVSRPFEIDMFLNQPLPDQFDLYLPKILLSGDEISFKSISYTKKSGTYYQARPW